MKTFIVSSLAAAIVFAQANSNPTAPADASADENDDGAVARVGGSSACLYCRNQDVNAGFLVSYSFCEHQDTCLKDAWNYIRRDCLSEWKRGNELGMDDCTPEEVSCPSFTSSPELY